MDKTKQGWHQFLHWCQQAEDAKTLEAVFGLLLTPEEKKDITTRCLIVSELIAEKHTQRDIAKNLNVSIAKITRGSNELKRVKPALIQYIKDHLSK